MMENNNGTAQTMENKGKVVLIEDNDSNREAISLALEKVGFSVISFALGEPAVKYLSESLGPTVVVSDIRLPDLSGIDLLKKIKGVKPDFGVILITGYGSIEDAVEAMKLGADDYLTKPLDLYKLRKQVESIANRLSLAEEVENLKNRLDKRYGIESIIGNSPAMEKIFEQVKLVAPTNGTVMITGESGTGKEMIANSIHQLSPRKHKRFLPLNCAAIPTTILESELFGYEKGAFTGAAQRRAGKFEVADQGSIFLDEISEISPDVQVKLLRILEGMEFMRVGGTELIKVDTRVITATNKNLKKMVEEGKFREDLYYRLKVIEIHLPSLRERKEDIPLLVDHFIKQFSAEQNRKPPLITAEVMNCLVNNIWKGNVRELKNMLQSVIILHKDDIIEMEHLQPEYAHQEISEAVQSKTSTANKSLGEIEKAAILDVLNSTQGNRTKAAKVLGIGLRTLQRKLKEYGFKDSD
jgi:DNA-binding NtrC family response regulator